MTKEEIKELRIKLGLSQRGLGEKIGATKTSVYKWEAGRSFPHRMFIDKLDKLAKRADKIVAEKAVVAEE
jgi:transcriptional regulator with XRE-family HTH domain